MRIQLIEKCKGSFRDKVISFTLKKYVYLSIDIYNKKNICSKQVNHLIFLTNWQTGVDPDPGGNIMRIYADPERCL